MALNAVDISPNFSPESLKLLADTLLLAARQKQNLALPYHLSLVLNHLQPITAILTRLGRTDLRLRPKADQPMAEKTDNCPQCGAKMFKAEGCATCPACAFSVCSL